MDFRPGDLNELRNKNTWFLHKPRRFHGSVSIGPMRIGRGASKIAEEIIQHLSGLPGADLEITLEIQANIPQGIPDNIVGTVRKLQDIKIRNSWF